MREVRACDVSASPSFQRDVEALHGLGPAELQKVIEDMMSRLGPAEHLEVEALLRKMVGRNHA